MALGLRLGLGLELEIELGLGEKILCPIIMHWKKYLPNESYGLKRYPSRDF